MVILFLEKLLNTISITSSMAEELEIYDLKGKLLGVQDRAKFYSEIKKEFYKKGRISRKIKSIRLLMMNSDGKIYLQKRSKYKEGNMGMYDKTIGGHVKKGDSYNLTVMKECAEELGFPASILSKEEFDKAIKVTDLKIIGIFRQIEEIPNFESVRIDNSGKRFIQPFITPIFIGYFDGPIRFVDGESSGIEVFLLEELREEINEYPDRFTEDIKFMIKRYEKHLKPLK
jgi:isopentenyldiphosphate isomerase